jgi:serine phosphatase RsbU (regulator of sigma subunit)
LFLQASKHSLSPAAVAQAVHDGMSEVSPHHDTFVTAFYGVLHLPTGRLTYVRAAQERPLWFRPQQGVTMLTGNGRFLGLLPDLALTEETVTLQPGDRLVLFSDGVPDAINRNDEHFGLTRLEEIVRLGGGLNAHQFVDRLAAEVVAWCRGAQPFDDLAFLVVEVQ